MRALDREAVLLRSLLRAPRYVLVRPRRWRRVVAIWPCANSGSAQRVADRTREAGEHAQIIGYRPDEEDMGPLSPHPGYAWAAAALVLISLGCWLLVWGRSA